MSFGNLTRTNGVELKLAIGCWRKLLTLRQSPGTEKETVLSLRYDTSS